MSASTRNPLPTIIGFEYDLGNGWQPYQESLTFTADGGYNFRYRGMFEDGSYDVTLEVIF